MTMPHDIARLQSRMQDAVKANWKAFLIEGIVLVILGMAAIAIPQLASIAATIFLGWMFLISGAVGLYLTFSTRGMPGFWWSLISALLAIAAGLILLVQPIAGTLTLTIVVGAYFIAEGIATIMYALEHRKELSGRWGWLLASGILDLLVAAAIVTGLPGSAAWAIGLLVGINLVFGGTSLIGMALAARKGSQSAAPANALDLSVKRLVFGRHIVCVLLASNISRGRLAMTDRSRSCGCGRRRGFCRGSGASALR